MNQPWDNRDSRRAFRARPDKALPLFFCCGIAMAACLCAAARWGLSHGLLFGIAGLTMLVFPPRFRYHPGWILLGLAWLGCGLLAFLPSTCSGGDDWRTLIFQAGIGISSRISPQPSESAVVLAGITAIGFVALWITGHGCGERARCALAFAFVSAVTGLAAADLALRSVEGTLPHQSDFGFFPNRNHTACLLVMAVTTGVGLFVQGVRNRKPAVFLVSCALVLFLLICLLTRSSSRAGVVLLILAMLMWALLLGKDYFSGNAGKACGLLLLATVLGFVLSESTVKTRLLGTLRNISEVASNRGTSVGGKAGFEDLDGRVGIAKGTLDMIREMPWTGCGSGQFRYIFPQYRHASGAISGNEVLHPESSWLWIAAETGVPSLVFVFALCCWIVLTASRAGRRPSSRSKALCCACVAGAAVPLFHGFFDVSAHRSGILWSAALLAAMALPQDRCGAGRIQSLLWRGAGIVLFGFGSILLIRHSREVPLLPSERSDRLVAIAWADFRRDSGIKADASGGIAMPDYADPILQAIGHLDEVLALTPMDARAHGLMGMLALHFDDKDDLAEQSFARHRVLDPSWIGLPLVQAEAWSGIDPQRAVPLWHEAVRRARTADRCHHGSSLSQEVLKRIRQASLNSPQMTHAARSVINDDHSSDASDASDAGISR